LTSSKSVPIRIRSPKRSSRSTTCGRPMTIGVASFSSMTTCTARRTRSSSPSANTMRARPPLATAFFAIVKIGFMKRPEW
jgi:hypothetical protein